MDKAERVSDAVIEHKDFGRSLKAFIEGDYIRVVFESGEEKRFMFPQAFVDGYLTTDNPEIIKAVEDYNKKIEAEREAENEWFKFDFEDNAALENSDNEYHTESSETDEEETDEEEWEITDTHVTYIDFNSNDHSYDPSDDPEILRYMREERKLEGVLYRNADEDPDNDSSYYD